MTKRLLMGGRDLKGAACDPAAAPRGWLYFSRPGPGLPTSVSPVGEGVAELTAPAQQPVTVSNQLAIVLCSFMQSHIKGSEKQLLFSRRGPRAWGCCPAHGGEQGPELCSAILTVLASDAGLSCRWLFLVPSRVSGGVWGLESS